MEPLADPDHAHRMCALYNREMLKPHLPKGMFLEEMILPVQRAMDEAFDRFCPRLGAGQREACLASIVGQGLHLLAFRRMYAEAQRKFPLKDIDRIVAHIVAFSAAGVRAVAEGGP